MSESQLATTEFPKASTALSLQLGLEPRVMIDALKSQFFKGKDATDAQLAVVVSIARELKLNPLLPGHLYPYPDRTGSVVVMIGPDGIYSMLSNNPDIVAQKDGGPAFYTEHGTDNGKDTCTAYINHRTKGLLKKTIWVDEWVVSSNPNWASRRHHMSEVRALKQAARLVIHGIPADSDEHAIGEMMNVTPEPETPKVDRPAPPERKPRGSKALAAAAEVVVEKEVEKAAEAAKATETPPEVKAMDGDIGTPSESGGDNRVAPTMPRLTLKDGEKFTGVVTVVDSGAFLINMAGVPTPSIKAAVEGDYKGLVFHKGGAVLVNAKPSVPPLWTKGARLKVTLSGFLNTKARHRSTKDAAGVVTPGALIEGGALQTFVESAEPVTDSSQGEEMEA